MRVSRGSVYSSCASSTCIFASLVRARVAKMSRMSSARSTTRVLSAVSTLRPCAGESSSSKMMTVACFSSIAIAQLLDLALAEIGARVRAVEHLRHFADDRRAGRVRELRQLFEMLAQLMSRARGLDRRADENGALRGRVKIDRVS